MVRIVVFDSGLGSLSVIKSIQKFSKSEIIYLADQKNYPYGNKTKAELKKVITKSLKEIKKRFTPTVIVIGSNTPTLMLNVTNKTVIGVTPPLIEASKISKTKNIAVLATRAVVKSKELSKFITKQNLPKQIKIHKLNGSPLVELVESGKFLTNKKYCKKVIHKELYEKINADNVDVITLSSTHLPFLRQILKQSFPQVQFLDPADSIGKKIQKIIKKQENKNKLKIFTTGELKLFQDNLRKLGIKNKVNAISF